MLHRVIEIVIVGYDLVGRTGSGRGPMFLGGCITRFLVTTSF
jgi:hypothetical protein